MYVPWCVLTRLLTKYMTRDRCWKSYSVKNKTSKASTTKHQQDHPIVGNTTDRRNVYTKLEDKLLKYCACGQHRQKWGIPIHLETSQTPIHKGWPTERQLACAIQVVEGKMDTHCPVSINQYDIRLLVPKNQADSGKQWHWWIKQHYRNSVVNTYVFSHLIFPTTAWLTWSPHSKRKTPIKWIRYSLYVM